MIVPNQIPEFTMPEEITEQTQIDILNQRIRELEKELRRNRKATQLFWNEQGKSLGENLGFSSSQTEELEKIVSHWIRKYNGDERSIYKEIINAPLNHSEIITMAIVFTQIAARLPKGPTLTPMDPMTFFRMLTGGK